MMQHGHNPKYLQKLGIIQRQLDEVQNTEKDHALTIIDGLCDVIRNGQQVGDFKRLITQLNIIETSHDHELATSAIKPALVTV